MDGAKQTGRTIWDVLYWLASSGARTAITLLALAVVLLALVGGLVAFVHSVSEPGTDISLFGGLIQYKKARILEKPAPPPPPQPPSADTSAYLFPRDTQLREKTPIVVLDRTLSVTNTGYGYARLAGANMRNIRVAARGANGSSLRPQLDSEQLTLDVRIDAEPVFEVEYKGNYFTLDVKGGGEERGGYYLTVSKVTAPSMDLKRVEEY